MKLHKLCTVAGAPCVASRGLKAPHKNKLRTKEELPRFSMFFSLKLRNMDTSELGAPTFSAVGSRRIRLFLARSSNSQPFCLRCTKSRLGWDDLRIVGTQERYLGGMGRETSCVVSEQLCLTEDVAPV